MTKYQLYEPGFGGPGGDVGLYVRIYQGVPLSHIPRPFRYRVLTPFLARAVPLPPHNLLRFFDMSPDKLIQYRFGVVNMVALVASGVLFVLYGRALGFDTFQALLCAFLFYTSLPVTNYGGSAMAEAWAWAFLLLGFWAAVDGRPAVLFFSSLIGGLAKEVTFLVIPAVLLLPGSARSKLVKLASVLPGILVYTWFRFVLYPGGYGFASDPATAMSNLLERLHDGPYYLWILFDGATAFGLTVVFAAMGIWALRRSPQSPLARLAWLVPVVFFAPFFLGSNIGRIWFYAFPVVIPLAVVGIGRIWSEWTAGGGWGAGEADSAHPPPRASAA